MAGKLPLDVQNLTIRHSINHEIILKSALTKDFDLALKALLNDPLVRLEYDQAKVMLKEMFEGTRNYLPGWKVN